MTKRQCYCCIVTSSKIPDIPKIGVIVGAYLDADKNCIVYDAKAVIAKDDPACLSHIKPVEPIYTAEKYAEVVNARDIKVQTAIDNIPESYLDYQYYNTLLLVFYQYNNTKLLRFLL